MTNLPGFPPPYLHTVSDQILEVGTAWERGYLNQPAKLCTVLVLGELVLKVGVNR